MFFKTFFKNKFNLVLMIASILSIIPLAVLVHNALDLLKASNVAVANDMFIKDVLSRTLMYTPNLVSFILGLIVWTIAGLFAAYSLVRNKTNATYAYMSLVLGGIGIHIIVFFILWIINVIDKKWHRKPLLKGKGKAIVTLSAISATAVAPVVILTVPYGKGTFDDAMIGEKIQMSFDEKNPNLIEVFTDGSDRKFEQVLAQNTNFRDFTIFDKFQTAGVNTHKSIPMIFSSFAKNNPFAVNYNNNFTNETQYSEFVYTQNFFNTAMDHVESDRDKFSQVSIVNPMPIWKGTDNYGGSASGNSKAIKEYDSSINVTNWSGARDSNVGEFGISNLSPDRNTYTWFNKNLEVTTNQKGARVYLADLITHRPFLNHADGTFTLSNVNYDYAKMALFGSLMDLVHSLQNLKNPDQNSSIKNAYDNSMIIIYGDHASHETEFNEIADGASEIRKTESLMMVKYPQQRNSGQLPTINTTRAVYAPQVNRIISEYFNNHNNPSYDPMSFYNDPMFDPSNPRPSFIGDDMFYYAKWNGDQADSKLVKATPGDLGQKYDFSVEHRADMQKIVADLADKGRGYE